MASTYIQRGNIIEATAAAAVASADIVQIGSLVGVALNSAAIGETYRTQICGVFDVPKLSTDDVSQGAPLYFDAAEGQVKLDDEAGANALAGYAWQAAGAGIATVELRLLF